VRSLLNKIDDFSACISTYSPDIFCITESWLKKDIPDGLVCPPGYDIIRYDRLTRGGGIILFINSNIKHEEVSISQHDQYSSMIELVCVDVYFGSICTRVIAHYRPPGTGPDEVLYASSTIKLLKSLCSTRNEIVLMGDFNLPGVNWLIHHAPNNAVYNEYISFFNSYGLYQHVCCPTRDNNVLDLVFTTSRKSICELDMLPPIDNRDHSVILFKTTVSNANFSCNKRTYLGLNWKCANYEAINYELSWIDWNFVFQFCFNVQQCWNVSLNILQTICSKHVPQKRSRKIQSKTNKMFYPTHIKQLINDKLLA